MPGCRSGDIQVHHIVPVRLGGDDAPENLTTLCLACHKQADAEYIASCRAAIRARNLTGSFREDVTTQLAEKDGIPDIYTAAEVAVVLQQSPKVIHRIAKRLGIGRMLGNQRVFSDADLVALRVGRRRQYYADERAAVVRRYQGGETLREIATALDMPVSSAHLILCQSGITLRPVARRPSTSFAKSSA